MQMNVHRGRFIKNNELRKRVTTCKSVSDKSHSSKIGSARRDAVSPTSLRTGREPLTINKN